VGNAYVCRSITGAIVRRQPFGGWKRSCFGPGAKAGGPNYVAQFSRWHDTGLPSRRAELSAAVEQRLGKLRQALPAELDSLTAAAGSDAWWWQEEFGRAHDPTSLYCESNQFRYRPVSRVVVRAAAGMSDRDLARVLLGAAAAGVAAEVSLAEGRAWLGGIEGVKVTVEDQVALCRRIAEWPRAWDWVLRAPAAPPELWQAAVAAGVRLVDHPVVLNGRIELLPLLREQAVSETLHRLGNVLPKPAEVRAAMD
jgi:RHH-type proline utilization regulon transcriptional repressor/proline dehydrogenase/delta 1-pyrroline-5-carboxylate dehydrogenase